MISYKGLIGLLRSDLVVTRRDKAKPEREHRAESRPIGHRKRVVVENRDKGRRDGGDDRRDARA